LILPPEARVALYYTPTPDDLLWSAGTTWLGGDPETNARLRHPDLPGIVAITADARIYGFHATLRPPMRLRAGCTWEELVARTTEISRNISAFDLPPLAVADLSGFLALCETAPCPALRALADAGIAGLDEFRAPPSDAELARRRRNGLSPDREAMLVRWGYPDVFDTWIFHMTLTRRLTAAEAAIYRPAAEAYFAEALRTPRQIRNICLFVQPARGAPFTLAARLPLHLGLIRSCR
jgi:putative phosphonate metabolism protein